MISITTRHCKNSNENSNNNNNVSSVSISEDYVIKSDKSYIGSATNVRKGHTDY